MRNLRKGVFAIGRKRGLGLLDVLATGKRSLVVGPGLCIRLGNGTAVMHGLMPHFDEAGRGARQVGGHHPAHLAVVLLDQDDQVVAGIGVQHLAMALGALVPAGQQLARRDVRTDGADKVVAAHVGDQFRGQRQDHGGVAVELGAQAVVAEGFVEGLGHHALQVRMSNITGRIVVVSEKDEIFASTF